MRSDRYQITLLPNGLLRVFDLASKHSTCDQADGMYRHGDLRAATLGELLGEEQDRYCVEYPMEEVISL